MNTPMLFMLPIFLNIVFWGAIAFKNYVHQLPWIIAGIIDPPWNEFLTYYRNASPEVRWKTFEIVTPEPFWTAFFLSSCVYILWSFYWYAKIKEANVSSAQALARHE